ncbi:IFIH1 [Branchiostoma lanceolatum]|uniref:Activating signal cointegrator 1 complex subunit 3 n=2 Tax=Branchiostoma lanceolatum TaxID=7740 RepID=A0A8K0ER09_BRALA|nr:IFIH1 [Branchiostoma lanceolatum]
MATGGQEASEESFEDIDPYAEAVQRRREEIFEQIDPNTLARYLLKTSKYEAEKQDIRELTMSDSSALQLFHFIMVCRRSNDLIAYLQQVGRRDQAAQLQTEVRRLQALTGGRNMPDGGNKAFEHEGSTNICAPTKAPIIIINNYHNTTNTSNVSVNRSTNVVVGDQNTMQVSQGELPGMDGDFMPEGGDYAAEEGDYTQDEGDYTPEGGDYTQDGGDYTPEGGDYTPEEEGQDGRRTGQPGDTRVEKDDDDVIILGQYEEEEDVGTDPKRIAGVRGAAGDWTEPKRVDSGEDWGTSPKELCSADSIREKTLAVEQQGTGQTDDSTYPKRLRSLSLDTDVVTDFAPTASRGAARSDTRENRQEKPLTLRNYQKELAEPAIRGKNTIVCAPTGSGKTHVAMYIIKEHLDKRIFLKSGTQKAHVAKVLVLTPEVTILDQHYRTFCRYLPLFRTGRRSGSYVTKWPFDDIVEVNDITVATPAILLNALRDKTVKITDFSLIVFDECHHTRKDAPYNKIMAEYLKIKVANPQASRPQIVGLSASPGAGGKPNLPGAEKWLLVLIASLDAEVFRTVEKPENIAELEENVNTPSKHVLVTDSRPLDPFRETVEGVMTAIEALLPPDLQLQYGGPRGVQEYQSAVDLVKKQATEERNMEVVQQCDHLLNYNKALQMNNTARIKDAMEILTDFYSKLRGRHKISSAESQLLDLFEAQSNHLIDISKREDEYPNPKLMRLEKEILKAVQELEDEFRGILFVKTRALTQAILSWVKETPALRFLNPGVLTGSGGEDVGRLTHGQQVGVIKKFNDGNHKLLIATSIAEEGLDIRDCNMVIKYNYATNEIAMVQARGRARAAEGKELVIADVHIAEKDRVNALTVEVSEKAIKNVQSQLNSSEFQEKVRQLQLDMIKDREEKKKQQEIKKGLNRASDVKLCCKGCPEVELICYGNELRLDQCNYIYPSRQWDKVEFRQHTDKKKQDLGIKKVHCKTCGFDLGNTHKGYPCLKISSFNIVLPDGTTLTKKKWKDVPFALETMP